MSLRLGVDLDGTVADLSSMYHAVEAQLFGERTEGAVDESGAEDTGTGPTDKERLKAAREAARRNRTVWKAIQQTPDFWMTLAEIEPGAVRLLYETSGRLGWDVCFITQRPRTAGASVQWQSQQWLIAHGFKRPTVLPLRASRGRAAHVLALDYLIDDLAQNCVDVVADSKCRPLMVVRECDKSAQATAQRLNITVVPSVRAALELLAS